MTTLPTWFTQREGHGLGINSTRGCGAIKRTGQVALDICAARQGWQFGFHMLIESDKEGGIAQLTVDDTIAERVIIAPSAGSQISELIVTMAVEAEGDCSAS